MGVTLGILSDAAPEEVEAKVLLRHPKTQWEGWGCSLAWCGKAIGNSAEAEDWADLLFTKKDAASSCLWRECGAEGAPQVIPGLGLNIVRYNVGGTGFVDMASSGSQPPSYTPTAERRSQKSRGWFAEIEGFQPEPGAGFDWERDGAQRRFLSMAVERGVDNVELFANAPMWWMTDSNSSFGGNMTKPNEFASYLGEITAHARSSWNLPVKSISPLNEPSAGWWKFPHNQEGCNVPADEQSHLMVKLRGELDQRGLHDVLIAASDENTPATALATWDRLRGGAARGCVGRLNVHAYDGLKPWREAQHPGVRRALHRCAGKDGLPLWMSEHGNGEAAGLMLAGTILEDLCHLRPGAWCYWQLVEHKCSWGLIEADFKRENCLPTAFPHPKYYVFAHFTRYLRPGFEILQCTESWAVAGFSEEEAVLVCVLLNAFSGPCRLKLTLPAFSARKQQAEAVFTEPKKGIFLAKGAVEVAEASTGGLLVTVDMPPEAICSLTVDGASCLGLSSDVTNREVVTAAAAETAPKGLTAEQVRELASCAAWAAVSDRLLGESDAKTVEASHQLDHARGSADAALKAALPDRTERDRELDHILQLVFHSAWGAANERKWSSMNSVVQMVTGNGENVDAKTHWTRFHSLRKQHIFDDHVIWMVFDLCWSIANEAFLGPNSKDCEDAKVRAEDHFTQLGPSFVVLPRRTFHLPTEVPSAPRWLAFIRHARALHNVDKAYFHTPDNALTEAGMQQALAARWHPAGDAVRAADLIITSPLRRAVETTRLLLIGRNTPVCVKVEALATERFSAVCDNGTAKSQLLEQLPRDTANWEGWDVLEEVWWPGSSDQPAARQAALCELLRGRPEGRIAVVGHGGLWKQLLGCYLDNCDVVYADRDLPWVAAR